MQSVFGEKSWQRSRASPVTIFLLIFKTNFKLCICVCLWVMCMSVGSPWRPEEGDRFPRAGLETVLSCLMWALETEVPSLVLWFFLTALSYLDPAVLELFL